MTKDQLIELSRRRKPTLNKKAWERIEKKLVDACWEAGYSCSSMGNSIVEVSVKSIKRIVNAELRKGVSDG